MTWHWDDDTTEEERKAYAEHEAARFKREMGSENETAMLVYTILASWFLGSWVINMINETCKVLGWQPETEQQKQEQRKEMFVIVCGWLLFIPLFFLMDWLVFGLVV
jgi:hypothetical protein